ncbi:MAG: DUF1822 family protein [Synechococcales bacterium]|nr:DUF1822 family protein [Synechococcales bacterium]
MSQTVVHPRLTIPLAPAAHRRAQQRSQAHRGQAHVRQVYLNTLAQAAVDRYLGYMGFETDWEAGDSSDPILQALLDVADLQVCGIGALECRPILMGMEAMGMEAVLTLPPETQDNRVGYVGVGLEPSLQQAALLGFVPTYVETVAIAHLRPLDDLVAHLRQLADSSPAPRTCLSQWLQGLFPVGWCALDELIAPQPQLAGGLRTHPTTERTVRRAKILDLTIQVGLQSVLLLVAITPEQAGTMGVSVQLHPLAMDARLPLGLRLGLLSEAGECLQEVRSRPQDHYIQLRYFRGALGEAFEILVAAGGVETVEAFLL